MVSLGNIPIAQFRTISNDSDCFTWLRLDTIKLCPHNCFSLDSLPDMTDDNTKTLIALAALLLTKPPAVSRKSAPQKNRQYSMDTPKNMTAQ